MQVDSVIAVAYPGCRSQQSCDQLASAERGLNAGVDGVELLSRTACRWGHADYRHVFI